MVLHERYAKPFSGRYFQYRLGMAEMELRSFSVIQVLLKQSCHKAVYNSSVSSSTNPGFAGVAVRGIVRKFRSYFMTPARS